MAVEKLTDQVLIIVDWDDTLFPTSWLQQNSISKKMFLYLDRIVHSLLISLSKHGTVVVVTNAAKKWYNASSYEMPLTKDYISKNINVVSARDIYKPSYPKNTYAWKKLAFRNLVTTHFNKKTVNQDIVSIGDADYEHQALINLYRKDSAIHKRTLKSVRLKRRPSCQVLIDELIVLNNNVTNICNNKQHMDLVFSDN